jgi:hypothetical protein
MSQFDHDGLVNERAMARVLLAFAWIPVAAALAFAVEPEGRIGDLAFDATRWEVRRTGEAFDISCRSKRCDVPMTARIMPGATVCAEALREAATWSYEPKSETIVRPGLDIVVVRGWTGCRNARPPSVHACAVHKGRTYRFDSPVIGCNRGPGFSDGALAFLNSLEGR